ncbi:hypothetical protein K457DRAFT_14439 [Linnemannia elongata AG-77]|uniref:Uncharacterized protein n=1 Tax=Linnemannia elongata AG-77 TaxID=1314771 RepID=A0A197KAU0_9FUNG|nr:hypothetical protein K457DRAFT_14439 [Linnemannia elongata AG-77]
MWIFRGLASIQQQLFSSRPHSKARTKSRTNKSSPLDVPEILEHILNHVDDTTVCLSVVRVCRSWHILQQHRIVCEVLWRSNPTPKQPWTISEEQGHRATHLYCYFQQDGQLFSDETNWLINYLRAKAAKAKAWYDHAKDPVAECGSGRDGRLETSEHRSQESIFDAQPLCGLAFRIFYLTCHRSPPGRFKSREIQQVHRLRNNHFSSLRFQSLTLINVQLSQICLETLLSICPKMQSLKVVVRGKVDIATEYDVTHLCAHLKSLSKTLETF